MRATFDRLVSTTSYMPPHSRGARFVTSTTQSVFDNAKLMEEIELSIIQDSIHGHILLKVCYFDDYAYFGIRLWYRSYAILGPKKDSNQRQRCMPVNSCCNLFLSVVACRGDESRYRSSNRVCHGTYKLFCIMR